MTHDSARAARRARFALRASSLVALVGLAVGTGLGVTGCSPRDTTPTIIPTPSVTGSVPSDAEWGLYDSREDACFGVASDVLTLALVPNNLALADPGTGVGDIEDTITTAGAAAPPSVSREYRQLATIVRTYGVELAEWSEASAATAAPIGTPGASGTVGPTPGPTPDSSSGAPSDAPSDGPSSTAPGSPTPTPTAAPARPAFDDAPFSARLAAIKTWLSATCG